MSKRKEATEFILKWIGAIDPTDQHNVALMRSQLEAMSDKQFEDYMRSLLPVPEDQASEQEILPYYLPNLNGRKVTIDNNLKIAEAIGHKFYEHIWSEDPQTGVEYLTPNEHLIIDLPIRRQAQLLVKKASIPQDNKSIDELSGQVTGDSKGSKISFPELQAQASQNLEKTIIEQIKIRGGDEVAYREFERQMLESGTVSQDEVVNLGSKVKSTKTLANLLRGMHLGNNFDQ